MSTVIHFTRKQLIRHIFDLCRRMGEWKPDVLAEAKNFHDIKDAAQRIVDLCELAETLADDKPQET